MDAILALWPHLAAMTLVWLFLLVIIQVLFRGSQKVSEEFGSDEEIASRDKGFAKTKRILTTVLTSLYVISLVGVTFFLYTPGARTADQMDNINLAPVPADHRSATDEQIDTSNQEAVTKKPSKNKQEATRDNNDALDAADKLFSQ